MARLTLLLRIGSTIMVLCMTAYGQTNEPARGRLKISVTPSEAYTFLDGQAIGHSSQSLKLNAGTHHVMIANYGYKFLEQDVSITAGKTTSVAVALEQSGAPVPGPKGSIQLELGRLSLTNAGVYAVLLTGKDPRYFVGHIDEFNNYIINKQQLFVPPGTYQLTVRNLDRDVWSGPVSVEANQRVIVNISNGNQRKVNWPSTAKLDEALPRFKAGTATASVVIAPVSGAITATPTQIRCGQQSLLAWSSAETIDADISGMSPVPTSGERTVSPARTTEYQLTATGPGGVVHSKTAVEVDSSVGTDVSTSPAEVRYRRIGDKVIEQDPVTLTWSSSNANAASISSVGSVDTSGSQTLMPTPKQDANGTVDETAEYTLTATNPCGGTGTKTASVHITGSIEPIPSVALQSVFYPTAYPTRQNPVDGLLKSQKEQLDALAAGFAKYLEYDPQAKMEITAHTDPRGGVTYNQALSLRRAELVRQYLVTQGVAAERIETTAVGEKRPLSNEEMKTLMSENPSPAPPERTRNVKTSRLAYGRRVDILLDPTKQESSRYFPNSANDSHILWQRPMPPLKAVKGDE